MNDRKFITIVFNYIYKFHYLKIVIKTTKKIGIYLKQAITGLCLFINDTIVVVVV